MHEMALLNRDQGYMVGRWQDWDFCLDFSGTEAYELSHYINIALLRRRGSPQAPFKPVLPTHHPIPVSQ